jgi:hypothetical protein
VLQRPLEQHHAQTHTTPWQKPVGETFVYSYDTSGENVALR